MSSRSTDQHKGLLILHFIVVVVVCHSNLNDMLGRRHDNDDDRGRKIARNVFDCPRSWAPQMAASRILSLLELEKCRCNSKEEAGNLTDPLPELTGAFAPTLAKRV